MNSDFTKSFRKINKKEPSGYENQELYELESVSGSEILSDDEDENNFSSSSKTSCEESEAESEVFASDQSDTEEDSALKKLKQKRKVKPIKNSQVLQEETDFVEEEIFFSK